MNKLFGVLATGVAIALITTSLALAGQESPSLVLFEAPGITVGDDAVECTELGTHRECRSDADGERLLSHDGLAPADRVPLDFRLLLPPEPATGPDGGYPLVVFLHGWGDDKDSIGGGLEAELVSYAEAGYAVLAYTARAWGRSCGPEQRLDPECDDQWNHLGDARWEVRDTQALAGLLADELSDTGTPLVDPSRIGVVGVSYGGGQAAQLAALRDRVVNLDGTVAPWRSLSGKPLSLSAVVPVWAWTDLPNVIAPNGRMLDDDPDASYRGPDGDGPLGVSKASVLSGLWAAGLAYSAFEPPGGETDTNTWVPMTLAGEPYLEETSGEAAHQLSTWHSGLARLDAAGAPAPTLFVSGWPDDIFPVNEALVWMTKARHLHPEVPVGLFASDFGHTRSRRTHAAEAKAAIRSWLDHHLQGIGPRPAPAIQARTQACAGAPSLAFAADSWDSLSPGEVRLEATAVGYVMSNSGPTPEAGLAFDPILGERALAADGCTRVPDQRVPGSVVIDLPPPGPGGYTVLGTPTVVASLTTNVWGTYDAHDAQLVVRLLDVDPSGDEQLLARMPYRPEAGGRQTFQLSAIGHHVAEGHHLQLELLGHGAPTFRPSNLPFTVEVASLDLRIPVAERPDGFTVFPPVASD